MIKIIERVPLRIFFALSASSTSVLSSALSAEEAPLKLADVVVTATKTGEISLQEVPSSITVINEEQLLESGTDNIEDLTQQTPGLGVTRNGQASRIYMRGVGTNLDFIGSDPSVTVHVDGIYQSRTTTALDDFLEVERVEVLRGPQGTLYGSGSLAGTVRYKMNEPELNEFYGNVSAQYSQTEGSNGNNLNSDIMLNIPISDRFAFRANVGKIDNDGIVDYVNIYNLPIYLTIYSNSRYYLNEELDTNAVYNFEIIKGYEIEDLILELDYNLSFF